MHDANNGQVVDCPILGNGTGRLLTPPEVAGFLQVKLPRVYELVKAKRLRAVKVGRQLRFRPQDLEMFLQRSTTGRW